MNFGFLKIAAAIPEIEVADCRHNTAEMEKLLREACQRGVSVIAFPELSVTGYTCGDLFGQPVLLAEAEKTFGELMERTADCPAVAVAGLPVAVDGRLYNAAAVFCRGKLLGIVPKTYLPNYNEYYEVRWFASGDELKTDTVTLCGQTVPVSSKLLFRSGEVCLGIELCEDLWVPVPPSSLQAVHGANVLVNLSASNEMVGKHDYLRDLVRQQSARTVSAYLYASAGCGESTTDVVFAGNGLIAENGVLLEEAERFVPGSRLVCCDIDIERLASLRRKTNTFAYAGPSPAFRSVAFDLPAYGRSYPLLRHYDPTPFVPSDDDGKHRRCEEIFDIQCAGLARRIRHTGARTAVIGISGGLDSTLALLVAVRTFDLLGLPRQRILGVTMPGFGTTDRTYDNAMGLMRALGVEIRETDIRAACLQHFADIGLEADDRSVTYENAQARERTQILMDLANRTGGMVVGTGDLSELALGWATYNGDHMSMYGVNCSIPKTLVRHLVGWIAATHADEATRPWLLDIIDTPISPELLPADERGDIAQRTEDLVGPYELHDFFLYHFMRFGVPPDKLFFIARHAFGERYAPETIKKWLVVFLRRFFAQQFKRSAMPDGPKVGSVSLSPRGDWRMPSDASAALWIARAEAIRTDEP
ncbi:NAD(+) synthase [uncultured Alistipes sp.]|uniref:NAD(+) synthase n=1 Tax=uncultured Alistipes sp. TaxID=538949 RepID=UPI002620FD95|nr:NAD(+) synthase [uncultured Alistipes sp.]